MFQAEKLRPEDYNASSADQGSSVLAIVHLLQTYSMLQRRRPAPHWRMWYIACVVSSRLHAVSSYSDCLFRQEEGVSGGLETAAARVSPRKRVVGGWRPQTLHIALPSPFHGKEAHMVQRRRQGPGGPAPSCCSPCLPHPRALSR